MIKFCKRCQEEKRNNCPSGYYFGWKNSVRICPICGGEFKDIDFPQEDLAIIEEVSQDVNFIEAMIKLRQENIIEYKSRMSQFRTQVQQQEEIAENNIPHCPTCGSTNIEKITATSKVFGAVAFGLFSKTARSQFKCKNCGAKW